MVQLREQEQRKHPFLPKFLRRLLPDSRYMNEVTGFCENTFSYNGVYMCMSVDKITEGLDRAYHCGNSTVSIDLQLEHITDRIISRSTQLS